jgi:small subunit ribosomal protein S3
LGHKVNPNGFRLGIIKGWESRWYANRNYKDLFAEDRKLRDLIRKRLHNAAISRIEIERVAGTQLALTIHTAKPGIVIGKNGESVERLRQDLEKLTKKKVRLNILEIRNPDVDAHLVARSIAEQLEKRVSFRRAMKQAVQRTMRAGAKGIKVVMGGRLGGAEIARSEKEVEGSVPLQTLRANIDYGLAEAHTTFGVIGVKVWIYHGDVLPEKVRQQGPQALEQAGVPAGERGPRPERGERGPRGERGGFGERGPRGGGERGGFGGERGPRPGGPRAGGPGGPGRGGERTGERRPPRAGAPGQGGPGPRGAVGGPGASTAGGARGERRVAPTGPRELATGEIVPEVGPTLPSSGPVTPSPAGEPEFPASTASERANPVEPAKPLDTRAEQAEPGSSASQSASSEPEGEE